MNWAIMDTRWTLGIYSHRARGVGRRKITEREHQGSGVISG